MSRFARRYALLVFVLTLSGGASAVGLGDLRGQPVLGQPIQLEIDLLGVDKQKIEASCFRLVQPSGGDDLPWLRKAALTVRKGAQPVLEIRSDNPLREPILEMAIQLGCGHEISRDYMLMATPPGSGVAPVVAARLPETALPPERQSVRSSVRGAFASSPSPVVAAPPRLTPRRAERRPKASPVRDRLMLSDGGFDAEPSLRLATDLFLQGAEAKEAQREILRLEFRMLMALHEQATTQMAAAEKLHNMEGTLGEIQLRAVEFAKRVENNGAVPASGSSVPGGSAPNAPSPTPGAAMPAGEQTARSLPRLPPPVEETSGLSEWTLYGVLLGAVFGLAGWLGWRQHQARQHGDGGAESGILVPVATIDPKRDEEVEENGAVDLSFGSAEMAMPMEVDFDLHAEDNSPASAVPAPARGHDSVLSMSATTLNEQFEANPVMELADIMLSFGRVKGAAQALQEYIDQNPQEALQPWIRLMDIYRMAGMRAEFESVASNLHQNFNVEVQSWDEAQLANVMEPLEGGQPQAPRATCLEDMPRLINMIVTLWDTGDVVGYIYQLLRDNRGGQRLGFSLPVVEDLVFLIELKETANRMEKSDE
ncbi:FimV family protein [Dechloromonas sp. HYN0024]|uniref:type IV pilus assembly protein FimV n=1 Tax=Dechloromonas sp. HYN0024 TaxID=2231055 RepID=UPI000E43BCCE|nr:hypothetical protein [Dechloromonas sp. HYN0024]AXS80391.1 hypothetical protein HYN24_10385 [Dechloromonas sp. HYN0024]